MRRPGRGPLGLAGLALMAAASCCAGPAWAELFRIQARPTLRLEGGWDSNVFNAAGGDSDWVARVSPRLELSANIKGSVVRMSGGVEGEWYYEHEELNHVGALKNVNLAPDAPIPLSSRVSIAPAAWYVETSDLVRRNAIIGGPVTGAQPQPVNVLPRSRTKEYAASIRTVYRASSALDLSLEARGLIQDIENATATLNDSRSASVIASAGFRLSARNTVGPYLQATRTLKEPDTDTNEYTGGLRGEYRRSPSFIVRYSGGARLTREEAGPAQASTDSWSPVGSIGLNYISGTVSAGLDLSYEETAAGNFGPFSEEGTARFYLADQLAPRWNLGATAYYKYGRFTFPTTVERTYTLGGSADLKYLLAKWISARLGVSGLKQWSPNPLFAFEEFDEFSVTLGFEAGHTFNLI